MFPMLDVDDVPALDESKEEECVDKNIEPIRDNRVKRKNVIQKIFYFAKKLS